MSQAVTLATKSSASPGSYELTHVHNVYDAIAPHFSSTRYKPWPVVATFLARLPAGSVGLDAGTGNGKYLIAQEGKYWTIGLDRSVRLLDIAKHAGDKDRECVLGDVLETCWRDGVFDYAISIATIHHLSTPERRKKSIQSLLRCLSPSHGRALIYVWATQQDSSSKRSMPPPADDKQEKGQGRDVFVPWVLSESSASHKSLLVGAEVNAADDINNNPPVYNRYYHMFDEGELRALVLTAAEEMGIYVPDYAPLSNGVRTRYIDIVEDDWERSNYYVEFRLYEG